jgi:retron-type reverse transcriptase
MKRVKPAKYDLKQSPLYRLKSRSKLAEILCLSIDQLDFLNSSKNLYFRREKVCAGGKSRCIEEPKQELKDVHKQIQCLLGKIKLPEYIYGLGENRCPVHNAKAHANSYSISTLDIEKFFPSVPKRRVYWFFHKIMECSRQVSGTLASILSVDDHLPTGSPSSPLLSYFSYIDMWKSINDTVTDSNCIVTFYIDDITISGDHIPKGLIWEVRKIIHGHGLRVNLSKCKTVVNSPAFEVTGVLINKKKGLMLPNRHYRKVYEEKRRISKKESLENCKKSMQVLQGLYSQAKYTERVSSSLDRSLLPTSQ